MTPLRWLLALLVLAGVAVGQTSLVDPAGRIAFVDTAGRLNTVRPDGGGLEILSGSGRSYQFPVWSPDGDRIAVVGSGPTGGVLEVFSFDGEPPIELYASASQTPFYLYWSPDSLAVSFLANHPTAVLGLHLVSLIDRRDRTIMTGSPFYWQWSADGASLLAHIGFSGPGARLGFSTSTGDTLTENLDAPGFFQAPAISPSGRHLAYASRRNGARTIVLRSAPDAPGEPVEREVRHVGLTALAFSPVDDVLALMRPPEDAPFIFGSIMLLDAESGLLEPLVDDTAIAFFWSPDGSRIAYLSIASSEGGRIASAGAELVALRNEPPQQGPLLLSLRVAEVASGEISDLGTFLPSRMFVQQFLPFFDQYALSHRIWSPDSRALVFPILDDVGNSQVTVVTLDGARRVVGQGEGPFWNVR